MNLPKPIQYLVWSVKDFGKDNGPQWAAALAYYALLSIFPLALAALSIASLFVDPQWAVDQVSSTIRSFLPVGEEQVRSTVQNVFQARGGASIVSIALLLWTGSRIFGVATQALNIAFDADESYGFLKRIAIQFAMAATIGVLLLLAVASRWVIALVWNVLGLPESLNILRTIAQWLIPGLLLLLAFFLTYRYVPRKDVHTPSAWIGALVATALFLIAQPAFGFYVTQFGNYNLIYGSLAIVIILVLWAWLASMIFLFGGQVASLVDAVDYRGKTREDVVESHERRSPVRGVQSES